MNRATFDDIFDTDNRSYSYIDTSAIIVVSSHYSNERDLAGLFIQILVQGNNGIRSRTLTEKEHDEYMLKILYQIEHNHAK